MATAKERKLTGWHVLAIFVGAFGIIIGVNLALAYNAVKTFPGLEVKNSYIASQTFNDRKEAQEALGWDIAATLDGDMLLLSITDENGRPVQAGKLEAKVGRPTNVKEDITPEFSYNGRAYVAYVDLRPGNWDVWLKAVSLDGTEFQQRLTMTIGG
ncbi:FixH family protein [Pacificoceanicola onchidii]|uniref:FixH family protein n=1 Tax=Pacificoceanicola onchidii TaxID=2562685 RepID=UPI00197E8990|nr:FixH family protein [Pacificoceanicola onchidii]